MEEIFSLSRANMRMIEAHVADIAEVDLAARPAGAPNHPLWQIGHLAIVRSSFLHSFGATPEVSREWVELFRPGSRSTSDATAYPNRETLLNLLKTFNEQLLGIVPSLPNEVLSAPNPIESIRPFAPDTKSLLKLILTTHDGYHIGQIAVWRGIMGLKGVL